MDSDVVDVGGKKRDAFSVLNADISENSTEVGVSNQDDNESLIPQIENKNSTPASKVAVINLRLQEYGKSPSGDTMVQFRLTRITLEPMLRSMGYISQQLSAPANRVVVINLKVRKCNRNLLKRYNSYCHTTVYNACFFVADNGCL